MVEDPQLTFGFDDVEDVATGVVFLSVALVVGLLVGQASEDWARASRREQARFLGTLSSTLHTREVPDRVLHEFAEVLLEPFALSKVEVEATLDGTELRAVSRTDGETSSGPRTTVPLLAEASIGRLVAERPPGGRPFSRDDQLLLEAAARQATAALDRARLDARARIAQLDAETNQLRAAMFSSVTHDLRTPLASIKAGVTSLLDAAVHHDPEQERELLTTILEETDRLNRLVGNLLDLARIRAGALTPTRQPAAMDEIVEVVLARMRPRLARHTVAADLPSDLPDVSVDPVQLDQVLTNLLENAGRHAPEERDRVGVQWIEMPSRSGSRIRDRGSRWTNANVSSRRSIVDRRAPRRRAAVWGSRSRRRSWWRTVVGSGSRAARTAAAWWRSRSRARRWPREPGVGRRRRATDPPCPQDQPRSARVRGADRGHRRGSGDRRGRERPELMLLDLGLPDLDGTEVIRRVRGFTELPIIVLSVRDAQQDKVAALDAGADDYVTKPFAMEELLARARAAMRRAQPGEPPAPTMRFGALEMDLGRRLVILGGETLRLTPTEYQLLEAFATHPGKLLTHQWLLRKVWGQGYGTETTYLRTYVRASGRSSVTTRRPRS